jgi:predicted aconitase
MFLTDEEKRMLNGDMGFPVQKSMQILVTLGESFGAERMLEINNVHMPGASIVVAGEAGTKFVESMYDKGGKFCAFTTTNPGAIDVEKWEELGIGEEDATVQKRLTKAYKKMGAVTCGTCTPYFLGNNPRKGEHVAWGESSAIAFVNSVLGARTNREGGPSALAAALTGRVPAYGLHLDENRFGKIHIKVDTILNGTTDYGTLGYYVGSRAKQDIPVFEGIPTHVSNDELKGLGAALASSGAVALFHVVGVTPEAASFKDAFGGKKPEYVLNFGLKEKEATESLLNKEKSGDVDWVVLGCPHASIQEFRDIAKALNGKKIKDGVAFWVCSSQPIKSLAERMGYAKVITDAGGVIVCDTCPVLLPARRLAEKMNYKSVTTNSAKMANLTAGQFGLFSRYGQLEQIVDAAVKGIWR